MSNASVSQYVPGEKDYERDVGHLVMVSGNQILVRRHARTTAFAGSNGLGDRGNVVEFSQSAAARMRRYLRSCRAEYRYMLTLTYPANFEHDGRVCKEHLRRFLQELRRRLGPSYSAFWFLEFQRRGAPHFHVFVTDWLAQGWVAETWARIVGSNDPAHLAAGTRTERLVAGRAGTVSYAVKYALKAEQKTCPEGYLHCGRYWGVSGMREVVVATTFVSVGARTTEKVKRAWETLSHVLRHMQERGELHVWRRSAGTFVAHSNTTAGAGRLLLHATILAQAVRGLHEDWAFDNLPPDILDSADCL